MGLGILWGLAIPIVLAIVIKKRYKTSLWVFFVGCATWFLFAMVLEQFLHLAVLSSPLGTSIQNNIWLYGLYGGLAAGIFEETGRFLAVKYAVRKHYENPHNAIMYGAGHGGFEALFILGTGMLNNIIYSIFINAGQTEVLLSQVPDNQREALQSVFTNLIDTKAYMFLMGDVERISAVILHIALSVFVWAAVVNGKKIMYPLAILLHALVDAVTVIVNGLGVSVIVLEVLVFAMALAVAFLSRILWKKHMNCESE